MRAKSPTIPIVNWLPAYRRGWLAGDVVAGLTVWGLIVPEGMAYAGIAGLPPEAGLYTVLVSLVAYAVFGTSRHVIAAATSATAALVGSTVAAMNPKDAATLVAYGAALVLVVGVLFLVAGFAKVGFIAQFLSRPVTEGFVLGLAIFVAVGQLNKVFGVSKGSGNTFRKLWHVITELGDANWWSVAIGGVSIAALFVLPRLSKRLPAGLVVLAAGIGVSELLDLSGRHGVDVVGTLPKGLPSLSLPHVGVGTLWILIPAGLGIVLVAYSEALGVAESFAMRHGYEIDPNQELLAFGAANLASGLFGGLVACGGMSASAVNDGGSARSQVSGLTACAAALVTVVALTPLFRSLPEAVLAALIIHAVSHMMSVAKLKSVYRLAPAEFWLGITALLGVLALDVLQGLLIAMGASMSLVIYRSSLPSLTVLGRLPAGRGFGAFDRNPDAVSVCDDVLVLRFDGPLYYANASSNGKAVKEAVTSAGPGLRAVVLSEEAQHRMDVTSSEMLVDLAGWLRQRSVELYLTHVHIDLYSSAERAGIIEIVGADHVVPDVETALAHLRNR